MATPTITPATPRGLVAVTGGSGYIAGYCIAQLLSDGWRVRTTVRNLGRAEEVRATIGKIAPNAGAIEFVEADLNSDGGWANAVTGADYVLHVASPVPAVDPKSDAELVRPARAARMPRAPRRDGARFIRAKIRISTFVLRVFNRGGPALLRRADGSGCPKRTAEDPALSIPARQPKVRTAVRAEAMRSPRRAKWGHRKIFPKTHSKRI